MANVPNTENGFFTGATEIAKYLVNTGATLERAQTEAANTITEIDGAKYYWDRNNHQYRQIKPPMPDDEIIPAALTFFTLDGVIDYIRENTEGLIPEGEGSRLILQVEDHCTVTLWTKPSTYRKQRSTLVKCKAHVPDIIFGKHMDTEAFNTMLLSKFIDTEARAALFQVVRNLTKQQECKVADDGVSQVLTVKQGVSLTSNTQFENPCPLKPMRTFAEVDQPESNFTLRVNDKAEAALFEADGGAWKNEAVANVKEYLRNNLLGCNVVVIA